MKETSKLILRHTAGGNVLCLAGKWRKEFSKLRELENVTGIEISTLGGEGESNLGFINEFKNIRYFGSLYSFPFDYSALYSNPNLRSLKFLTLRESSFDFGHFPNLESAIVPWHQQLDSIFKCPQLKSLSLLGFRKKESSSFTSLPLLQVLKLKDASLVELNALSELNRLKRLELGFLPKLVNFIELAKCNNLEILRFFKCGKSDKYHVFGSLKKLNCLIIDTDKEIENIEFTESLHKLRVFNFTLKVCDGNIKRLLKCPVLASAHFADRRHYDIRRDELNEILADRNLPLSNAEDSAFRSIGHGINDWRTPEVPEQPLYPRI